MVVQISEMSTIINSVSNYRKQNDLSEMVFSKSMKAPPHINRIFFVSICSSYIDIRREIPSIKRKNKLHKHIFTSLH